MISQPGKGREFRLLFRRAPLLPLEMELQVFYLCLGSGSSIHAESSTAEMDTGHCRELCITKRRQWQRGEWPFSLRLRPPNA